MQTPSSWETPSQLFPFYEVRCILFFFKFYVYVQPFGLWKTTDISTYVHALAWLYLAAIIVLTATFGLNPPEFTQATPHLLGRCSAPFLMPLLSILRLSFSRILAAALALIHFLVSWLTIFSRPGAMMRYIGGVWYWNYSNRRRIGRGFEKPNCSCITRITHLSRQFQSYT